MKVKYSVLIYYLKSCSSGHYRADQSDEDSEILVDITGEDTIHCLISSYLEYSTYYDFNPHISLWTNGYSLGVL